MDFETNYDFQDHDQVDQDNIFTPNKMERAPRSGITKGFFAAINNVLGAQNGADNIAQSMSMFENTFGDNVSPFQPTDDLSINANNNFSQIFPTYNYMSRQG